jgi:hypothetical protein
MTVLFHLAGNTAIANESLMCKSLPLIFYVNLANTEKCILVSMHTAKVVLI